MLNSGETRGSRWWIAIPSGGVALFIYLQACYGLLGVLPAFGPAEARWRGAVALDLSLPVQLLFAILLAAAVFLWHRVDKTPNEARALGFGLLLSILPNAAVFGSIAGMGLTSLALVRALILTIGLMALSWGTYRWAQAAGTR